MSSKFDAYEIIGIITPGSIILFGLALLFPDLKALFFEQGFSLGDLGLFLVLSFVAGHLIQTVGNLLETTVWACFGGMPTDWLIEKPQRLIHETQVERLRTIVKSAFGCELKQVRVSDWAPIIREMYAVIQAEGNTARIDSFNRTYGLMRGVSSAFTLLAVAALVMFWPNWKSALLISVAAALAGYRMVRFGKRYGRELVVEYLRVVASRSA